MEIDIFTELTPKVGELIDRHLTMSKEWFPHEMVPWSRGRDFEPGWEFDPTEHKISEGTRSALFVNLLTEDNLPYYVVAFEHYFGGVDGPWGEWGRRWTAEENRHSIVIRDWLTVSRYMDPVRLERARMAHASAGWHGASRTDVTPWEAVVYVALQELSTRIAHRNTGNNLDDPVGRAIMKQVAADENLHFLFYRDLATAAFELDPSKMVQAVARMTDFEMPGTGIPDFNKHSRAIAAAGIFDLKIFHDNVLAPLVYSHWKVDKLEGLTPEADQIREQAFAKFEEIGKMGNRMAEMLAKFRPSHSRAEAATV